MNIKELLKGKKSYIIAGILILIVVCEKVLGIDVPGIEVGNETLNYILAALGVSTMRAAIASNGNGNPPA